MIPAPVRLMELPLMERRTETVQHTPTVLVLAVLSLTACQPSVSNSGWETGGTLEGIASVIDGDTIEIHGERIRLSGFDSPERGTMCGSINVYSKAAFALSDFIGTRTVRCDLTGRDSYDRHIGNCEAGGEGLGDFMVRQGWARDWPRYSDGAYGTAENEARKAHRGIWGLACPEDLWGQRNYE